MCGILLLAASCLQLKSGSPAMSWQELGDVLFMSRGEELHRVVVWEIRMPRLLLGMLTGAMLGTAGMLMQGAMNNKLAGPELLGVSAGASLAVAAITVMHLPVALPLQPFFALLGGLLGGVCVLLTAKGSRGTSSLLLIGMSVSAILNGLLLVLIALGTGNDVNLLYTYLLGSLANRSWEHVQRLLPWAFAALPSALMFMRTLNLLQFGDEAAAGLGVSIQRSRLGLLLLCTALVASTVAQCGPIGYISLIAPHLAHAITGTREAAVVLPVSALCGGVLLAAADTAGRLLLYPLEIPVGIWTTLLGGTFCLLYLAKRKGRGSGGGL